MWDLEAFVFINHINCSSDNTIHTSTVLSGSRKIMVMFGRQESAFNLLSINLFKIHSVIMESKTFGQTTSRAQPAFYAFTFSNQCHNKLKMWTEIKKMFLMFV